MTPFELWQAGKGPEPVLVVELPAARGPWRWRRLARFFTWGAGKREEAEAVEEMRAALAAALFGAWDFSQSPPPQRLIEIALVWPSGQRQTMRAYCDLGGNWRREIGEALLWFGAGGARLYAWREIPPAPLEAPCAP